MCHSFSTFHLRFSVTEPWNLKAGDAVFTQVLSNLNLYHTFCLAQSNLAGDCVCFKTQGEKIWKNN